MFFKIKKFAFKIIILAAHILRRVLNFALMQEASSIPLGQQRRAMATTLDYVEKHLLQVDSVGSKNELLTRAFKLADTSGERLICEFGVFMGGSINHLSKMTTKTLYGFDSFEGLPERWRDGMGQGVFAVPKLPKVRKNVILVKGLFDRTIPVFLKQNSGPVGFLHIDSDLYSSAKVVFELLETRLIPTTIIVFDDYFNYPGWEQGEYKAFMDFLTRTGLTCEHIGYNRYEQQVAVILREKNNTPKITAP
jgi:hypothetical protein